MKSSAFYAVLGIGIIIVVGIIWWGAGSHMTKPSPQTSTVATSTPPLTGMAIYTNGVYGFSIFYPQIDVATTSFTSYYHLPNVWRVGALPDATGTPLFSVVTARLENSNSYPRYFDTEVRVGVSQDSREVAACTKTGDGELPQQDVVINGTTWKAFAFQDAGMMQYSKGVSYRTVHNGSCFALEAVEAGSSYRDDAPSSKDIPDVTLTGYYTALTPIIQSFSFADGS